MRACAQEKFAELADPGIGAFLAAGIAAVVRHAPLPVPAVLRARHMSAPAGAAFAAIVEACRRLAYEGRHPAA